MKNLFEVVLTDGVFDFLSNLDKKHSRKIIYNIRKAQIEADAELFKKLTDDIWEFRTLFQGLQYRLLAFWDKTASSNTIVIATHGFIKKQSKVPEKEIKRALQSRTQYFQNKK